LKRFFENARFRLQDLERSCRGVFRQSTNVFLLLSEVDVSEAAAHLRQTWTVDPVEFQASLSTVARLDFLGRHVITMRVSAEIRCRGAVSGRHPPAPALIWRDLS